MLSVERPVLDHLDGRAADGAFVRGRVQDAAASRAAWNEPVFLLDAGLLHAPRHDAEAKRDVLDRVIIRREFTRKSKRDGEDVNVGLRQARQLSSLLGFFAHPHAKRRVRFDEARAGREQVVQMSPVAASRLEFAKHCGRHDGVLARAQGATREEGRCVQDEGARQRLLTPEPRLKYSPWNGRFQWMPQDDSKGPKRVATSRSPRRTPVWPLPGRNREIFAYARTRARAFMSVRAHREASGKG